MNTLLGWIVFGAIVLGIVIYVSDAVSIDSVENFVTHQIRQIQGELE